MKNTALAFYCILLLVLVCVCGCSPQKSLAQRLGEADRVMVTNSPYVPAATLTGEEMHRVAQAVASAPKGGDDVKSSPCFHLEFFKGTNRLVTVLVGDTVFGAEGISYSYPTGAIRELFEKFCDPNLPLLPR